MDYKKLFIIIIVCIFGFHLTNKPQKPRPVIYVVFNTLSCHQCNIELNNYLSNHNYLKNKCLVLIIQNTKLVLKSAKNFYPELDIKYLPKILSSIPDSLIKGHSLQFPFVLIKSSEMQELLSYSALFSNGSLDTTMLYKSLFK